MKVRFLFLAFFFVAGLFQLVSAQNISNEGSNFWAVFPTHVPSGQAFAEMSIFISSKENSSGKIVVGSTVLPFNVVANKITQIPIPRGESYINDNEAGIVLQNRGIHILVDVGKPKVAAYAHIFARARSEAYLILPIESLGRTYFSMNASGANAPAPKKVLNGMSFIVVVATEDNTVVNIKRTGSITTEKVSLPKAGDVYEILSDNDLTGSSIEIDGSSSSCKTFAAYSGHSGISLEFSKSFDPLAQQLYPVGSWGRVYGVVPFKDRAHFSKVIASEDNTNVRIDGLTVVILEAGESFTTEKSNVFSVISADKPISVAQFTYSQEEAAADPTQKVVGDPDMVILNPVEYSIKNITVFSSDLEAISEKYLNIFMKSSKRGSFKINGLIPKSKWQTVSSDPSFSYLQERVTATSLTLTADDNFNAVAYGFGNFESYAYSAGTNLATNQFLKLINRVTKVETTAACLGQASDFGLTLPYLLTKLTWFLNNGAVLYDDQAPNPVKNVVNGQDLYTYFAPVNISFDKVGADTITAKGVVAATSNNCLSGEVTFNFKIDVDPLPTADFIIPATGCFGQATNLRDKSDSNVEMKSITKWFWDFGDGTISDEENPIHIFKTSGQHTIKLYVGAESGCLSEVVEKQILITTAIDAKFSTEQNGCVGKAVTLKDGSENSNANILRWSWDMGDGLGKFENATNKDVNYTYLKAGKYTVSLTTFNSNDCPSIPFLYTITISDLPKSDFEMPETCVDDPEAIFINKSIDFDGSTSNLTYLWDFGDPSSGTRNTSTEKDGKHKYSKTGDYKVTLTVFNSVGCNSIPTTNNFKVNSSTSLASFEVMNPNNLCSDQSFELKNTSTIVGFGNITRLEWYFDGVLTKTDEDPVLGKIYTFTRPAFTTPSTLSISVTLKVFTGQVNSCTNTTVPTVIILNASPVVEFNSISPICLNSGVIQLKAGQSAGFTGEGKFSGLGVNEFGLFNPAVAGVGVHEISYTFTSNTGCSNTKAQSITVLPIPSISAGPDKYILLGGEGRLAATSKGVGLTYKWFPATGLDRDDILNPIATPGKDMLYTLSVASSEGCIVSDQVYVYVLEKVFAPNSFTPNGDGINDVWNVRYLESYPKVTVDIYNRNGQRVYFSRGYSKPFDGNFNNQPLPIGTYYYIINPNTGTKTITGDLTIIR